METICEDCGEEVAPGAARCAHCGRPRPDLPPGPRPTAPDAPTFGVPTFDAPVWPPEGPGATTIPYANRSAGPPPEGLDLLMAQHRLEQEERRRHEAALDDAGWGATDHLFGIDTGDGTGGETLGDLLTPTRDRQGNIEWDLKYALVGALIVAVVAGLVAAFVVGGFLSGSHLSRVS